jgi:hypothetical protein
MRVRAALATFNRTALPRSSDNAPTKAVPRNAPEHREHVLKKTKRAQYEKISDCRFPASVADPPRSAASL